VECLSKIHNGGESLLFVDNRMRKEGYNVIPPSARNKIVQGGIPSYFLRTIKHGISKSSALTHAKHRCVNFII
jgi:hypothetical protein